VASTVADNGTLVEIQARARPLAGVTADPTIRNLYFTAFPGKVRVRLGDLGPSLKKTVRALSLSCPGFA
jgi:hypothetical protein